MANRKIIGAVIGRFNIELTEENVGNGSPRDFVVTMKNAAGHLLIKYEHSRLTRAREDFNTLRDTLRYTEK